MRRTTMRFYLICFLFSTVQVAFADSADSTAVPIDPEWTQPGGPTPDAYPPPHKASNLGGVVIDTSTTSDPPLYYDLLHELRNRPYALRLRLIHDESWESLDNNGKNIVAAQYDSLDLAIKEAETFWKTRLANAIGQDEYQLHEIILQREKERDSFQQLADSLQIELDKRTGVVTNIANMFLPGRP